MAERRATWTGWFAFSWEGPLFGVPSLFVAAGLVLALLLLAIRAGDCIVGGHQITICSNFLALKGKTWEQITFQEALDRSDFDRRVHLCFDEKYELSSSDPLTARLGLGPVWQRYRLVNSGSACRAGTAA